MITAHLATTPDRTDILPKALESLKSHVNHIYVALNGHTEMPSIDIPNITYRFCSNSKGDAHKFEFINEVEGLVLITDDDLTWSKEAVELLVRKVEQYKCPISLHGKAYPRPYRSFKCYSGNYRCLNTVVGDHPVDVIGTGTLMFHTDMVRVSMSMFQSPNMADVWFSKLCKEQGVPLMVIEHQAGIVGYLNPKTTIWQNTKSYALHDRIIKDFLK